MPSGLSKRTQTVAMLRVNDDIGSATRRAIQMVGSMPEILDGRRVALLKPNFVAGRSSQTGATTHLELIAAVADAVHEAGAKPILCEFPGTEFDFESTVAILHLDEFCRAHDIGMIRQVDRWRELRPNGARRLKRFHVPADLEDACLINLPVLKTHVVSGMSIAMKNLMGLLPLEDRRTMHILGIQQCIVDLNRGIKPDLNLVDASVGQDGEGPLYGRPADLGMLVAGTDSLAVDLACCQLCQVDPETIEHLSLALAQLDGRRLHIVGDAPAADRPFELPRVSPLYRFAFWLMYPLDIPFSTLTDTHLCTALYRTGLIGTHPEILASLCTRCGECVAACSLPGVIDLDNLTIDPRICQRCLTCLEACPEGAIRAKGFTGSS
jgi:uncharacterized protein (DUF362 family)/Pyruvate/2-oxoacid:ferredoxin oxidoreductase delta subunit